MGKLRDAKIKKNNSVSTQNKNRQLAIQIESNEYFCFKKGSSLL